MTESVNHQWKLSARPEGMPKHSDFEYAESPIPEPADGQVLVKIYYISLDPAMRGWMNDQRSYIEPIKLGDVMRAGTLGQVVSSKSDGYSEGDWVVGIGGVQEYALSDGKDLRKVDISLARHATFLGALGMPGMTAYFGLLDICNPQEGETVVVSGAAGAVGAVVGQIAKIKGCRVIGTAGSPKKCNYLVEQLGFDAAINYKEEDLYHSLRKHCPKGIDIYFDNVGGETLDTVLAQIRRGARISICGAISQYNNTEGVNGPKNYLSLLINRARMEGFIVFDYAPRYGEAAKEIAGWITAGKLFTREHVVEGLETFPDTLNMLFTGENFGKLILKVAEPPK
ncbi:MAG: NADP-dependent oxidoreductase [Acidobacteriota bacterium]|nr:NADP-dependent oxidoreductase [Acidobacteriota bacterium]